MGTLKWYKRFPDAALNGMSVLTLEECGAYNLILDLIYSRDGELRDDDAELARILRCDIRKWRAIRRRLIDLEKLYLHGGMLRNQRADIEVRSALDRVRSSREAGLKSGEIRGVQASVRKDLTRTTVLFRDELLRNKNKKDTSF